MNGNQKMNKILIISLLLLTSCQTYESMFKDVLNSAQYGKVCFSVYEPIEHKGRYCLEKIND